MRQAGRLSNEADAQRFVDYLVTLGIEAKVDAGPDGATVWIFDENRLREGKIELEFFRQDPNDPIYASAIKQAAVLRKQIAQKQRRAARNLIDMSQRWASPGVRGRRPLTWILIGACVLESVVTDFGKNQAPIDPYLFMTAVRSNANPPSEGELLQFEREHHDLSLPEKIEAASRHFRPYDPSLPEIRHGQVWRLITPIFIHMDWRHLLFNMMGLFFLGGMIEDRYGSAWLGCLIITCAVVSNLTQYFWEGPIFGGMSGVVYALFGYIWMKGRFDPTSGLYIGQRDVMFAILFFGLCFTGMLGPIANGAHAGGLVVGMLLGYVPPLLRR